MYGHIEFIIASYVFFSFWALDKTAEIVHTYVFPDSTVSVNVRILWIGSDIVRGAPAQGQSSLLFQSQRVPHQVTFDDKFVETPVNKILFPFYYSSFYTFKLNKLLFLYCKTKICLNIKKNTNLLGPTFHMQNNVKIKFYTYS